MLLLFYLALLFNLISVSMEGTKKISKHGFESDFCPQKCRLNQNTRACAQVSSRLLPDGDEDGESNGNRNLTVSNLCIHFLQQEFKSVSDCQDKCHHCQPQKMISKCTKSALDKKFGICKKSSEPGPCKAYFRMWYYNLKVKDCQTFIYGGCGGNDNKFSSHLECLLRCGLVGFLRNDGTYDASDTKGYREEL